MWQPDGQLVMPSTAAMHTQPKARTLHKGVLPLAGRICARIVLVPEARGRPDIYLYVSIIAVIADFAETSANAVKAVIANTVMLLLER